MLKKLASFMVLMTMFFAFQSNVWAAAVNAQDKAVPSAEQVIRLEDSSQVEMINDDSFMMAATGFGGMKVEPWFWILSIPVSGLGQFLMGDVVKGLLFFFAPVLVGIIWSVLVGVLFNPLSGGGNLGLVGTLGLIFPLVIAAIWIWNIVDAYFMNQGLAGMASQEAQMKAAAKAQEQIQALVKFAEENNLVAYDSGVVALNHRLATF